MCTAAPNVKANFGTSGTADCYGKINFDSGAIVSYIHECMITYSDYIKAGPRKGEFYGAGGDKLKLKPYVINIRVNVGNKGVYEFKNVLVATSDTPSRTMLVGQSDLERLGIDISFARRSVTFSQGALKGVPLPMEKNAICSINPVKPTRKRSGTSKEDPDPTQRFHNFNPEDKLQAVGNVGADDCKVEECCVNLSKRQKKGEASVCPIRDPNAIGNPNGTLIRESEPVRQRDQETSVDKVTIINNESGKNHPIAAAGIRRLCGKYKSVLAMDANCLLSKFAATNNTLKHFEAETRDAVINQFQRKATTEVTLNHPTKMTARTRGWPSKSGEHGKLIQLHHSGSVCRMMDPPRRSQRRQHNRLHAQKRLAKKQKAEFGMTPFDDSESKSPLANKQLLTKTTLGKTVRLKRKGEQNDVPMVLMIQNIDYSKKQKLLRKNSSLNTSREERRLTNQKEERRLEKKNLSEFPANTVLLAKKMQLAPQAPLDTKIVTKLQSSKVAEPLTLEIEKLEILKSWEQCEIESDVEVFPTRIAEEKSSIADQGSGNRGKRTKSGRLSREPARFQTLTDEVKQKINFEQSSVQRTWFCKKKKKIGKT